MATPGVVRPAQAKGDAAGASPGAEALAPPSLPRAAGPEADGSEASSDRGPSPAGAESPSAAAASASGADAPTGRREVADASFDDERALSASRCRRFERCLGASSVDMAALRKLAWSGIPHRMRAEVWQRLLGYRPSERSSEDATLARRRAEYREDVKRHFKGRAGAWRTEPEQKVLRLILVDVPRTLPSVPLIHTAAVQRGLERVLFLWALRHPASGYVQGINDIAAPLFVVFLAEHAGVACADSSGLPRAAVQAAEADVFHCLTRLLDGLQDHYTPDQPGIQRVVHQLRELLLRIDSPLVAHVEAQGFSLLQLVFPWVNCLLLRELPVSVALRLWDTYFAEGGGVGGSGAGAEGFERFHTYVCAALLHHFSEELQTKEKTDLVEFVQALPTRRWRVRELEAVLSQAFIFKSSFDGGGGLE